MKIVRTITIITMLAIGIFAQSPDQWRGLTIDESTPEDAVAAFGSPKSDKANNRYRLGKWYTKGIGRQLRILHYENVEGFPDVKLGFLESKLAVIHLEPKKLTAQALLSAYGDVEFRFANEVLSPNDFKTPRNTDDKPVKLGTVYNLVAVTDNVIAEVTVGNVAGNVMSSLFGDSTVRQQGRHTPGNVIVILLISRKLENKDGVDLLK